MRRNLKQKVTEESDPIDRIVKQVYHNININSNDLVINLPSIRALQKQHPKIQSPVPQTIVKLPSPTAVAYCKTTQGEWSLLYDGLLDGTCSLIFATYNIYRNKNIGTVMVHSVHVHRFFIKFIQFMHITKEYRHHAFLRYSEVNPNVFIMTYLR